jgi:hypothetical protein
MNANGCNPLRWDCSKRGCYSEQNRPKIEIFADCFPGRINFGDVDAGIVEINSRALYLEWKGSAVDIPKGQDIMFRNLSKTGLLTIVTVAGNAQSMDISAVGWYISGEFSGWQEAGVDRVKRLFSAWAKRALALPPIVLRKAEFHERVFQKSPADEWIADYTAHEREFDQLVPALREASRG